MNERSSRQLESPARTDHCRAEVPSDFANWRVLQQTLSELGCPSAVEQFAAFRTKTVPWIKQITAMIVADGNPVTIEASRIEFGQVTFCRPINTRQYLTFCK